MMTICKSTRRPAAITPLAAIFLIFLLAMVAFAVDLGWVAVVKSDLQNVADSAALAGADPMLDGHVLYSLPGQTQEQKDAIVATATTDARARAKEYAKYNSAGSAAALTLLDSDIEFGFLDASSVYTPMPTFKGYPNTIKVVMRRDPSANQPLALHFGRVLGISAVDINATASATLYAGTINSFKNTGQNIDMLPVTFDVEHWDNYVKTGQSPDGKIIKDGQGTATLQLYPSIKYKGNFGQISLNNSHVGNSTEVDWVNNGAPPSDIQKLIADGLIPLSQHTSKTPDWQGNTGMKESLISEMNQEVGKSFIIPLFQRQATSPYQAGIGEGSDYYFNIVRFVAVKVVPSSKNNHELSVVPSAVIEPSADFIPGSVMPAGTSSEFITTFTVPKLSQ
jgi:hypothetical protein